MRFLPVFLVLLLISCSTKQPAPNKFSDPELVRIYDLKDRRLTDSLVVFLYSKNPVYRKEAALAFGSVQDSIVSGILGSILLEDEDAEVRRNAAFALGQTGGIKAVNALIPAIKDKDKSVSREVLEALGKTLKKNDITVLSQLNSNDSLLLEGLAAGFYQTGVRGLADSLITSKQAQYLSNGNSYRTRLAAAWYFARTRKISGKDFDNKLIAAAQHDKNADIRMAAVGGFRHLNATEAIFIIKEVLETETDPRVRSNAARVCSEFSLNETQEVLFLALHDSSEMVQITASEVIRAKSGEVKLKRISEEIAKARNLRVKSNLYASWLKSFPKEDKVKEIIEIYPKSPLYYKVHLLSALGEAKAPFEEDAFTFLTKQLFDSKSEKVILSSAASAITSLNRNRETRISSERYLAEYKKAISQQTDVAVTGIFASVLTNPDLKYKETIKDLSFLYQATAKLSLPRDIESLQPLENAIAYLEGKDRPVALKNKFNHPIDWKLVKEISADQKVLIKTNKGDITLDLFVEEDPGSVSNFVSLVKSSYYDGKFFHRVVPNFVIQTGCNRGDGYGSEDYSIRSEHTLRRYKRGSVGMASAGKDTEGTQWFITHSPTLHLDGRYTVFAETTQGFDVVDRIEVGDQIIQASLTEKKKEE